MAKESDDANADSAAMGSAFPLAPEGSGGGEATAGELAKLRYLFKRMDVQGSGTVPRQRVLDLSRCVHPGQMVVQARVLVRSSAAVGSGSCASRLSFGHDMPPLDPTLVRTVSEGERAKLAQTAATAHFEWHRSLLSMVRLAAPTRSCGRR